MEAIALYRHAEHYMGKDPTLQRALGMALFAAGDLDSARQVVGIRDEHRHRLARRSAGEQFQYRGDLRFRQAGALAHGMQSITALTNVVASGATIALP